MNPEICGVGSEAGSLTDCGSSKGWQKSTGWRIPISGQSLLGWNDLGTYPVFDRPYSHGLIAQACHGFIGAVRELRREVSARASCVCHSRCLPNTLANASRARMWLQIKSVAANCARSRCTYRARRMPGAAGRVSIYRLALRQ